MEKGSIISKRLFLFLNNRTKCLVDGKTAAAKEGRPGYWYEANVYRNWLGRCLHLKCTRVWVSLYFERLSVATLWESSFFSFFFLAKITWDPTALHSLAVTCKETGRSQGPTQLHMGAACMHGLAQRHGLPLATLNSPCLCESHHELTHWYLRGSAERRFSRPSEQTLVFQPEFAAERTNYSSR